MLTKGHRAKHRLDAPTGSSKLRDASHAFLITSANISRVVSVLALTIALGRTSGPNAVGQLSLLLATVAILQAVAIGGISGAAIHKLILVQETWLDSVRTVIAARLLLIPTFFGIGITATFLTLSPTGSMAAGVIVFFVGYGIGTFDVAEIVQSSRGRFEKVATRRILLIVAVAPIKLTLAYVGNLPAVLALQGLEAAFWQIVVWPGAGMPSGVVRESFRRFRDGINELRELRNLWLASMAAVLGSRSDLFIVAAMLGTLAVGQYSTASRLVEAMTIMAAALATVMLNKLTKSSNSASEYARTSRSSARTMFAAGALSTTLMALAGPGLIVTLYGPEFQQAADLIPVYALCLIPIFQRQLISKYLIIEKEYSYSLWSNVVGLAANLALNIALIPILGVWGAVFSAFVSYSIAASLVFLPTRRGRLLLLLSFGSVVLPHHLMARNAQTMIESRRKVED